MQTRKQNVHVRVYQMYIHVNMSMYMYINVYCPECPPGGTIGHPGGQQKRFLSFGLGRDLAAFNGTGKHNRSFQDQADIHVSIGLNPFGTRKMTRASGPIHYEPTDPHGV